MQANKAIVGRNAFAHEAGIHQDGMLKDRRTYEIMRPEDVGVPQTTLVLGKHSGRHAVQTACEQLGLSLSRRDLDRGLPPDDRAGRSRRSTFPTTTCWRSPSRRRAVPGVRDASATKPATGSGCRDARTLSTVLMPAYSTVTLFARFRG